MATRSSAQFRVVGPGDEGLMADIFTEIDTTYFEPHPFTPAEARRIAHQSGRDAYSLLVEDRAAGRIWRASRLG